MKLKIEFVNGDTHVVETRHDDFKLAAAHVLLPQIIITDGPKAYPKEMVLSVSPAVDGE